MHEGFACMQVCAVPVEARRGHYTLELELQAFSAIVWVLKSESRSSARATEALNC